MYARRSEICIERGIGLTTLYNQVDDGAVTDLRDLHRALGGRRRLRLAAGGGHDPADSNARLLALNEEIATGSRPYSPFSTRQPVTA